MAQKNTEQRIFKSLLLFFGLCVKDFDTIPLLNLILLYGKITDIRSDNYVTKSTLKKIKCC